MPTQILTEEAPNGILPTMYNSIQLTKQLVPFIRINMVVNIVLIIIHTTYFSWKFDSSSFMQFSSSFIVNVHLVLIQAIWVRIEDKVVVVTKYVKESLQLKRHITDLQLKQLEKTVIRKAYFTFLWITGCVLFLVIVNRNYSFDESFVEHLVEHHHHLSVVQERKPHTGCAQYRHIYCCDNFDQNKETFRQSTKSVQFLVEFLERSVIFRTFGFQKLNILLHQSILLDIIGILLIIIWTTISTIMMVSTPICFLYVMLQGKIAVIILIDYVCSINHMKCCCKTTMKHLKVIIKKHLEIIRYNQFVLKSNQYFYLLYLFNEIFFGLLPMFEYFSPNRSIVAVSSATIYFFCLVYAVNDAGEEYVTLVDYFSTEIYNLKWYEWDVSCRKVYSILITYLNKPMKVDFVVVNINRALFWKILKTLYPVLNFFYTTNRIGRV